MKKAIISIIVVVGVAGLIGLLTYKPSASKDSSATSTTTTTTPATSSGSSSSSNNSITTYKNGNYTGSTFQNPYGPVQVSVSISGGKISNVSMLQYPTDRMRSEEISAYATPILIKEAISAQSANVDAVSGATSTSEGFMQSLQSALDQAS